MERRSGSCGAPVAPILGQTPASGTPSEALLQDATSYADQNGVGLDEAVRRLQLQREIGDLDAALGQEERDAFAGLWIEHEPEYRVIVRFVAGAGEERLRARVAGTALERLVEMRPAAVSLAQLEERRATARQRVQQLRFAVDTDINVRENRVEIYSDRAPALRAALAAARATLPERVEIVAVARLSEPAVLRGGDPGSSCSGRFTVRAYNGELGISTAAHCNDSQFFQGVSLPLRTQDQQGNQDVQWHSACKLLDVSNEFNSGIGNRACVGTRHRDQQAIGSFVCKWGSNTGRTCGSIQSKNISVWWVSGSASTFVRVNGGITRPGDSGGPWFVEDIAYGITSGRFDDDEDGIYMPINYISSLGVSVLTFNPGPGCNLPPVANFTFSKWGGHGVDFDASSSYDPDGSIVSYTWDFGDGVRQTTTSPWTSHWYCCETCFHVMLEVRDNNGGIGYALKYLSPSPYQTCY